MRPCFAQLNAARVNCCRPTHQTVPRPLCSAVQADIWSCGVLLYVMLFVSFPHKHYSCFGCSAMQADIWSCGVLLYVTLFVSFPFADPNPAASGGGGPVNEAEQMRKVGTTASATAQLLFLGARGICCCRLVNEGADAQGGRACRQAHSTDCTWH